MERIFLYPCLNGVLASSDKKDIVASVNLKGKINLKETQNKKQSKFFNLFLLSGFFYLFYGIYYTFCGVFFENNFFNKQISTIETTKSEQKTNVKKDEKNKDKSNKKLNVKSSKFFLIAIYCCLLFISASLLVLILGYVPLYLSYFLMPKSYNIFLKRFSVALIKILLIVLIFVLTRFIPAFKQFYKFNYACKKEQEKKGDINFLSYFIVTLVLNTFIISLLGFSASVWYFFLINIFISFIIFVANYEIYKEFKNFKWFNKFIVLIENLVLQKSSQNEIKCVNIVLSEIDKNYNKGKKMQELLNNEILFSEAYFNAKEKLMSVNKFEQSDLDFIFCEILNKKRNDLKLLKKITTSNYNKVMNVVERRCKGEPITKIFGHSEFYGLNFKVTKDVLSPRMDTEILVEQILKLKLGKYTVLDIGTGSGAVAVSLAKFSNAKVTAVDISDEVLEVASENAKNNEVKVNFVKSDLFSAFGKKDKFDVIVSNPPYIPTSDIEQLEEEVKNFDPTLALDGGDDGLNFYRSIIDKAPDFLNKNGKIFFEVGINQAVSVKKLLQKNFKDIRIVKDYNKIDRVVCATLS